jgi:hypothetical protein
MTDRRGPDPHGLTSARRPSRPRSPDIEFAASVHADELRFVEPPETEVRFDGTPAHESASGSDRTNLPEQVEAGVTYRSVRVEYRLASRVVSSGRNPRERHATQDAATTPARSPR